MVKMLSALMSSSCTFSVQKHLLWVSYCTLSGLLWQKKTKHFGFDVPFSRCFITKTIIIHFINHVNLQPFTQSDLWFRELRGIKVYYIASQYIKLNKTAERMFYPLQAWIWKHEPQADTEHLDRGWGGGYLAEHLVNDQMTSVKSKQVDTVDLIIWIFSHRPWEVDNRKFVIISGHLSIKSWRVNRKRISWSVIQNNKANADLTRILPTYLTYRDSRLGSLEIPQE